MKQVNLRICQTILTLMLGSFLSVGAYAQNITVKGHVKDALGGVIGANVVEKGNSTNGTITDLDGNFTLTVPQGATLVVSFIGYKTQEVAAAPSVIITLQDDAELLGEVVVIGYGTAKKNDLTGSVTAISADKMVKGAVTSATDMLVGKAAGVSVITDGGAPGAGATIRVRGGSSMSASNNPLIVIDGVPVDDGGINGMSNPLATVHPNDIETFTILKDASATAIYGSRASNGVIIINTKKGKSGRVQVGYSGTFSINTRPNKVDVMSANEFREFVTSKFGESSAQFKALGQANTDWQDEIFKTSFSTDHNVNVSGAIPHMPYRVSVSYTNENGILKTSNMERLTGAISLNPNFFDKKLNIQLNVKGIYNTNRFADTGAIGMATQYDPTQPIYMDGNPYGNGYFMYMKSGNNPTPVDIGLANPVSILDSKHDESTVYRSIGNAQIDYKFHFLPELRANLNLGYDVSKSEGDVIIEDNAPMTWCQGNYKTGFGENSSYYQLKRNTLLDFYLNYAKEFGAHHVDVMGGYSWQHFYNSTWTKYPYSTVKAEETGKEFYKDMEDYSTENYLVSFFGRLNYTLLNRYLVTFTLRNDGSSRFNKDNRWGLFPSVALAWKMKEENFLKGVDWLSDLKLRLGYGITGQQNLNNGDYPYMARYMYSKAGANYYFGNNKYSLIAPQAYDENLKWEETTTYNIGLDFGVLNNKLTGTLDLYYRKTDDLLNTVTAPAGTNFSNQLLTNVGTLENKGIELSLTSKNIDTKNFAWSSTFNFTLNRNKIVHLYGDMVDVLDENGNVVGQKEADDIKNKWFIGKSLDEIWGLEVIGVWQQDEAEEAKKYGVAPGDFKLRDVDGNGQYTDEDKVFQGTTSPKFTWTLRNDFKIYKNIDVSFMLYSLWGHKGTYDVAKHSGTTVYNDRQNAYKLPYWTPENPTNEWARIDSSTGGNSFSVYRKKSFIRLDNISVGYNVPSRWITKLGLGSLRVYANVRNVAVWAPDFKLWDPENSSPTPRTYTFGINVTM